MSARVHRGTQDETAAALARINGEAQMAPTRQVSTRPPLCKTLSYLHENARIQ